MKHLPKLWHHPDCALGDSDHPGSRGYRCINDAGETLPFPSEDHPFQDEDGDPLDWTPEWTL